MLSPELDWRKESSTFITKFSESENDTSFLFAEDLIEREERTKLLLDIAKRYLHPLEAEILFLFLKSRRNKDISLILDIQEPEVARYKNIIIKKCVVFYYFCYKFDMSFYHKWLSELLQLNEKQSLILQLFFQFRSLSTIGDAVGSKSSNMHRSLTSIKEKVEELVKENPELDVVLLFYEYSRYVNNANKEFSVLDDLI